MQLDTVISLATSAIAVIVWLVRIEARLNAVAKTQETETDRMRKAIEKMAEAQEKMRDIIHEMQLTLAAMSARNRSKK
jgi:hypothetical protein